LIVTNSLSIEILLYPSLASLKLTLLSTVNVPSVNVLLNDFPFGSKSANLGIVLSVLVYVVKLLLPAQVTFVGPF